MKTSAVLQVFEKSSEKFQAFQKSFKNIDSISLLLNSM